jgi:hypothetical protein
MIAVAFAAEIRKEIRALMNERADSLATGVARSYDHYQNMVGEITGLAIAERLLLDAAERLERGIDNDR